MMSRRAVWLVGAAFMTSASAAYAATTNGLPAQQATVQALTELRANLETQSALIAKLGAATTSAELQQFLAEDSQLVSADLSLLNGLGGVSGGAGVVSPPASSTGRFTAPQPGLGATPSTPPGTPSGPVAPNPFPFP